jgi:glutaredoxin-related protein
MARAVLDEAHVHPAVRQRVAGHHADVVDEARRAVATHAVVVLGMRQNPFVKKARKALDAAGVAHHDIDHGSYFSDWRQRTALKMWTGWPTFPMVFVKGQLAGGADDVIALIASGELQRLLK